MHHFGLSRVKRLRRACAALVFVSLALVASPMSALVHFVLAQPTASLSISIVGSGTTIPAPGTHAYAQGANVWVDALPASGYVLSYWLLNGTNMGATDPYLVTMDSNLNLTAVFAPEIFGDGFESGNFSAWSGTTVTSGETATVVTTPVFAGTSSGQFTSNGSLSYERAYAFRSITSSAELYARGYFYVSASGIADNGDSLYFTQFRSAGGSNLAYAGWRQTGGVIYWHLMIRDGADYVPVHSEVTPSLNTWYRVELRWKQGSVGGLGEIYVDGELVCRITNMNTADYGGVSTVRVGLPEVYNCANTTAYADDCLLSTTYIGTSDIPLAGWQMDPLYTNASYVLSSEVSGLFLELDATDTSSRVTIFNPGTPALNLSDYTYIDVAVSGTGNAKILLRFFLDDGSGFDVVWWQSPATLDAAQFDLSSYAGRTLNVVYIALMSSDGATANITITQIAFVSQALPPSIPMSGWQVDPTYTNATYVLDSSPSSLYLELDAADTSSRVTIFNPGTPALNLSDYTYIDVAVYGTDNAQILLRFFLDDGTGLDVVWWGSPAALDTVEFDLSPYSGRTMSIVYIALKSSDGTQANITIAQIAFSTQAVQPLIPLSGWENDPLYTNASYVLSSSASRLFLELGATDTSSRVTIFNLNIPRLNLSDYTYVDVAVSGTDNAKILLRFFLDDGTGFDVVWWQSVATLDTAKFDPSPYAGRTLTAVYIGLRSSNGATANMTVAQIVFSAQAMPSSILMSGWQEDPTYTNATYVLDSSPSSLYLELDASNTSSRVTIFHPGTPALNLSDYSYINVTVSGTDNAQVLLRFFLDDGSGFDVVWWGSPAALKATEFDLSPYAGRALSVVYIALMSSDGAQANITITEIAFVP